MIGLARASMVRTRCFNGDVCCTRPDRPGRELSETVRSNRARPCGCGLVLRDSFIVSLRRVKGPNRLGNDRSESGPRLSRMACRKIVSHTQASSQSTRTALRSSPRQRTAGPLQTLQAYGRRPVGICDEYRKSEGQCAWIPGRDEEPVTPSSTRLTIPPAVRRDNRSADGDGLENDRVPMSNNYRTRAQAAGTLCRSRRSMPASVRNSEPCAVVRCGVVAERLPSEPGCHDGGAGPVA